jgi:RNA polymerase sigma factor (sigma-70 family)
MLRMTNNQTGGPAWSLATIPAQQILVDALSEGNEEAINFFFSERGCARLLHKLARDWAQRVNSPLDEAGDLFTEAALKLAASKFAALRVWRRNPNCHLVHWISRVVINHFKNVARRRNKERAVLTTLLDEWTCPLADRMSALRLQAIFDAMESLRPADREVIEFVLQGYSIEEIAAALQISFSAANARRHRALQALRQRVRRDNPDLFQPG